MRQRSIAFLLAIALLAPALVATPASADDGAVVAAKLGGNLPATGVAIAIWEGGSVETLGIEQPQVASIWVSQNGVLVGYLVGAPTFVNASFLAQFPQGTLQAGTAVLAVVGAPIATPVPVPATGYAAATWEAFVDTLLRPNFQVTTCPGCWPEYAGSNIGVTIRWPEAKMLEVYVYSGTAADIATVETELNAFTSRLDIPWRYAASPAVANVHLFMGFDRNNVPATFPSWALDNLQAQQQVASWSAYTSTSYFYTLGPNGTDPADRFEIDDAAIFVPYNQANGTTISRPLLDTNIRHELVHAIGWSDHWSVSGRLMSPVAFAEQELSTLEWDMLELLYDDLVQPGMYEQQLLATIAILN